MIKMNLIPSLTAIVTLYLALIVSQGTGEPQYEAHQEGAQPQVGVTRNGGLMNVHVPLFYEMIKNGNSMGINVLRGLVQVERGEQATRSGLHGPRPLSVRVFGVPVYERGTRNREPYQAPQQPPQESPQYSNYQEYQPNELPTNSYESNTADEVPNVP